MQTKCGAKKPGYLDLTCTEVPGHADNHHVQDINGAHHGWPTPLSLKALSPLDEIFLRDVGEEVQRARSKFPSSRMSMAALTEEVGELAQALLKVAAGKWPASRIREEAIQVACMALRVAIDGDESFTNYVEP